MTLEVALQQNTEAINKLTSILSGGITGQFPPPPAQDAAPKPVRISKKADSVKEVLAAQEPEPEAPAPEPEAPKAEKITYKHVQDAIHTVIKTKGTATAKDVLAGFNVANATKLDPKQWPALITACAEAMQ